MELIVAEEVVEIMRRVHPDESDDIHLIEHSMSVRKKHGFLGDHLTLKAKISLKKEVHNHTFFVKTYRVPSDNWTDFVGESGIFQKEVDLYKGLLQKFRELSSAPICWPEYYFSKHRVLVLKDLSENDFEIKKGDEFFDMDHVDKALIAVAGLHASSIIFERKEQMELDVALPSCFKELLHDENNKDSLTFMWKTRQVLDLTAAVDYLDKYTSEEKILAKDKLPGVIDKIYHLSKKSEKWPNVFTHGDLWRNNILFRYNEGRPVDCRIVDFQFSRYAPPMHDVMHLLHFNMDKSLRVTNEEAILKMYYEYLTEYLAVNGIKINEFYKWEAFVESRNDYKLLALIQSLLSIHYLLGGRKLEEVLEVSGLDWKSKDEYLNQTREEGIRKLFDDPSYVRRVGSILTELIDEYILNDTKC